MSRLGRRLWKWTAAVVAALLILLAVGVGFFRVAVSMAPGLRADAEALAAEALGWPVRIGEIDLEWALLGPELVLTDVHLLAPVGGQTAVAARRIDIVFGPLDLFQRGTPRPSLVRLHQPTLALERDDEGELFLSGYALPSSGDSKLEWRELLDLALRHGRLTIVDGELHYRDARLAIDDWQLRLPEVSLASNGTDHEFSGSFLPPGALGEEVMFSFRATGRPSAPEEWAWTLDAGVRELRVDWWYQQFQWAGPGALSGTLNLTAHVGGKGFDGMAGGGRFSVANLALASHTPALTPPGGGGRFERIALEWEFDVGPRQFALDVRNLEIVQPELRFTDGSFSVRTGGEEYPLEVAAARLPLDVLTRLAHLLPANEAAQGIPGGLADVRRTALAYAPRGDLREFILGVDTGAEPARFRVETRFDDLGVAGDGRVPGFNGVSGTLRGDERNGRLRLDSRDVVVDFGELFREPLPVAELRGTFGWTAADGGWRITGNDIALRNPEVNANGALTLELPAEGSPRIDLEATAENVDFAARSRWLPVAVMSDALIEWLDTAILAGRAPVATAVLKGPLENFPFRDGSGVFDIRFRAEDTAVAYAPGWPGVRDLSAAVHFHNASLDIQVDHADVMDGLTVTSGRARFGDFRDALLEVDSRVDGDLAAGWRFLEASPLAEPLAGLLRAVAAEGAMRTNVALSVPLESVDDTRVTVTAALDGARVHPLALPWRVEDLRGELRITEREVTSGPLTGVAFEAPFKAVIHAGESTAGEFAPARIAMQGRAPVKAFGEFLPPAWLAHLDGAFDWQGELRVPGKDEALRMDVTTALEGVTSTLPAPLDVLRPLRASISLPDDTHIDVHATQDALGAARLRFVDTPSGWLFDRGRIALGAEEVDTLAGESGLTIHGQVEELDGSGWLDFGEETGGEAAGDAGAGRDVLRVLDVRAAALRLGALTLDNQTLRAERTGTGWEVHAVGPATGGIIVPTLTGTRQPWQVRLQTLHLPMNRDGDAQPGEKGDESRVPDPRELPALALDIEDFRLGAVRLGHVTGALDRTGVGYVSRNLVARTPSFVLTLDGRWEFIDGTHYTSVNSTLESSDLGDTLQLLGYRAGLDADDARVETSIAWHGSPLSLDRAALEGTLSFAFEDGSLSEVSAGAGRLLGLLSIAALPRRLTLDFSDFFGEGLHFDTLSGDFLVTDGNAYTTNVRLAGPSVSALLVGRAGLVAQDYDQLAIIDPDVSSSLPVAGYIAAGPTVGAALLLLSQLLKAPLSDITQVKYRITGPWENPVIEKVQPDNAR